MTLEEEPRRLDGVRPDTVNGGVFSPDGTRLVLLGSNRILCASVTVLDVAHEFGIDFGRGFGPGL